mmetsp:Transcript_30420/g.78708  ORF Transcript_30420/g.78708 Transcript_30420/m.78708 type:complete len:306 (-) Transcript_30420:1012-1929(-)
MTRLSISSALPSFMRGSHVSPMHTGRGWYSSDSGRTHPWGRHRLFSHTPGSGSRPTSQLSDDLKEQLDTFLREVIEKQKRELHIQDEGTDPASEEIQDVRTHTNHFLVHFMQILQASDFFAEGHLPEVRHKDLQIFMPHFVEYLRHHQIDWKDLGLLLVQQMTEGAKSHLVKKEMLRLQTKISSLNQSLQDLEQKNSQLQTTLETSQRELDDCKADNRLLLQEKERLDRLLKSENQDVADQMKEMERQNRNETERLQKELQDWKDDVKNMHHHLGELSIEVDNRASLSGSDFHFSVSGHTNIQGD